MARDCRAPRGGGPPGAMGAGGPRNPNGPGGHFDAEYASLMSELGEGGGTAMGGSAGMIEGPDGGTTPTGGDRPKPPPWAAGGAAGGQGGAGGAQGMSAGAGVGGPQEGGPEKLAPWRDPANWLAPVRSYHTLPFPRLRVKSTPTSTRTLWLTLCLFIIGSHYACILVRPTDTAAFNLTAGIMVDLVVEALKEDSEVAVVMVEEWEVDLPTSNSSSMEEATLVEVVVGEVTLDREEVTVSRLILADLAGRIPTANSSNTQATVLAWLTLTLPLLLPEAEEDGAVLLGPSPLLVPVPVFNQARVLTKAIMHHLLLREEQEEGRQTCRASVRLRGSTLR